MLIADAADPCAAPSCQTGRILPASTTAERDTNAAAHQRPAYVPADAPPEATAAAWPSPRTETTSTPITESMIWIAEELTPRSD